LKENGIFVLNCIWSAAEIEKILPGSLKREIAQKKAQFYIIDAGKIAGSVGLGRRINMVMQAVFFKLSSVIPYEQAKELLKKAIAKTYGSKGQKIVDMNVNAVDQAVDSLVKVDVPASWADAPLEEKEKLEAPEFVKNVMMPQLSLKGDELPVSKFAPGGINPMGTTKFEKRGIASSIPRWAMDKCMQCNECSVVCPHAAIRPFLLDEEDVKKAPASFKVLDCVHPEAAKKNLKFRIQVAALDCTGCTICTTACNYGALSMVPIGEDKEEQTNNWDYAVTLKSHGELFDRTTIIGSQFQTPLLEFSGACEGCSETAYMKMASQLFGERMSVAQATGCASIWGGTWGTIPYTVNEKGHGPSWGNSLFEDNAEYGLGMANANAAARRRLRSAIEEALPTMEGKMKELFSKWLENWLVAKACEEVYEEVCSLLEKEKEKYADIYNLRHLIPKISQWIQGGDGWAYDIGYGGLDHVIASGVNVNIMVLDTEMYSNTGGQRSKATPLGAIAKFAAGGNRAGKKDLGMLAMSYKDVYVASISLQGNMEQAITAIREAEAYDGVSLLLCYSPCKEQGFNLANALEESRLAIASGYWNLYRYNPELERQGKNPLIVDSKEISYDLKQFLARENRYALLMRTKKDVAENLQEGLKKSTEERLANLNSLASQL
jgi:pyruvate-ferredoxin/flavodoxin oxidoreductase